MCRNWFIIKSHLSFQSWQCVLLATSGSPIQSDYWPIFPKICSPSEVKRLPIQQKQRGTQSSYLHHREQHVPSFAHVMIFLGALQSTHASYFIVHVADCLHCCLDNGICSLHVSHNLWVSFADCVSDVIAYGGCHVKIRLPASCRSCHNAIYGGVGYLIHITAHNPRWYSSIGTVLEIA